MRRTTFFLVMATFVWAGILGAFITEYSDRAQAQTGCAAPPNFRVTSTTSSTVSVAWDAVSGASSYEVWYAQAPDAPSTIYASGFTGTTATLYSLREGTTYNFAAKALCGGTASMFSNTITVSPGGSTVTTCQPPKNLRVTANDTAAQTVDLAWDLPDGPTPGSYSAYVSQSSGGPYSLWASGLPGPTSARLFSMGSTDWYIVVRSVCSGTESANSNEVRRSGSTTTTTTTAPTSTTTTTPPPGKVCNIAPADGEVAITAAVNSCPDGSTVVFPPGRAYTQNRRIEVKDRRDLIIDGNGSKFTTTSNGTVTKSVDPNWLVLRGYNITLKNMTVVGDFTAYEGQPRSLATIGTNDPEFTEAQMGFGLYGVDTVHLTDVKAFNNWGDGVTTGPDEYVDGSTADYTNNVFISRMEVDTVGRMCWGLTSGNNMWVEDSVCRDAWYGGSDAEADHVNQPLSGHHYLRNTFDGYNHFAILIPVITTNTKDIEIRDNNFLTPNDVPTYTQILVGMYPDSNPNVAHNVVVEGNRIPFYCQAIVLDHVDGGSIRNNTLTRVYKPLPDGTGNYTPAGICGEGNTDPIEVTNSTNVTVGPNTIT